MRPRILIPIAILALLVIIAIILITPLQPVTHALSIASACDPSDMPTEPVSLPLVLAIAGVVGAAWLGVSWWSSKEVESGH